MQKASLTILEHVSVSNLNALDSMLAQINGCVKQCWTLYCKGCMIIKVKMQQCPTTCFAVGSRADMSVQGAYTTAGQHSVQGSHEHG